MSTPLFPFPRFFFRERPASRGEKGGYMRIKPKNPKILRARRIIVSGVALAAVLFVLLRPNTDSSLSTEESAPMPETAATPVPEAEDAQGELNWQYPPGWVDYSDLPDKETLGDEEQPGLSNWRYLLVNGLSQENYLRENYYPDMVEVENGYFFQRRAADALKEFLAAARAQGFTVSISRTYMSHPDQRTRFNGMASTIYDRGEMSLAEYAAVLDASIRSLEALLATFSRGQFLEKGVRTAILGRPNAGKSSLLNALLGFERAIVTDIPGTTRDTLSERCLLGGVALRLTDTAGVRETSDAVESLGVERAIAAAGEAQLVIAVFDLSRPWDAEDEAVLAIAEKTAVRIAAANKSDCAPRWDASRLSAHFDSVCIVSAKEKTGLDALGAVVAAAFPMPEADSGEILTNARQADAVRRALEYLRAAREAMAAGFAPDAVLTECEGAMDALGALSGRSVREDVTQEIFSRFCVGK